MTSFIWPVYHVHLDSEYPLFKQFFFHRAKGFFHIVFEKPLFRMEHEFHFKVRQIFHRTTIIGVDLQLFIHLKFDKQKQWKLFDSVKSNVLNELNFEFISN